MSQEPAALTLLRERAASVPDHIRMLGDRGPIGLHPNGFRSVRTTGVGSSGAHARALAVWLAELGIDARYLPPGAFPAEHDRRHSEDLLIGFSQGLSPGARLALSRPDAWRQTLAVTSTRPSDEEERGRFAAELERADITLLESGAPDEFGTLVRIVGPATAYWAAWRIALAFGAEPRTDADAVACAAERAAARARALAAEAGQELARSSLIFVAAGACAEAADNLRLKWVEGLLREVPPVCDVLDFAHGPFQALHDRQAVIVSLAASADPDADELLTRLDRLLVPGRQRRIALQSELPAPLSVIEFECGANELLLAALAASRGDPADWPGRDADAALYEVGASTRVAASADVGPALEAATWPEIEAALAKGKRTAILPLGSTEQHGPGLPFATDTWIADALARRLAERVPAAIRLPALSLGAASEHLAFPGTLSLAENTLTSVLADVAASLAQHGFEEIFCFSAHGGNLGVLRRGHERLRRAAAPARWLAFTDHAALNAMLFEIGQEAGVSPGAVGQHAGELEASILDAVRPGAVRRRRLEAGAIDPPLDGDGLFYPDLRANAPNGVVGDPHGASRRRGARYLTVWVDALVRAFDEAQKSTSTTGTVNA